MIEFLEDNEISVTSYTRAEIGLSEFLNRKDLGFMHLDEQDAIWKLSQKVGAELRKKFDLLCVVGMGGSSLGTKCVVRALKPDAPIIFLDNLDPVMIADSFARVSKSKRPHFLVVSKSGGTLEVGCLVDFVSQHLAKRKLILKRHVTVITEPGKNPLAKWAEKNHLNIVEHPTNVGGRFSTFTPVGLIPSAFSGVTLSRMRQGIKSAKSNRDLLKKMAAFYLESFDNNEMLSVFWSYTEKLQPFSYWLIQKWAESLPKNKNRLGGEGNAVSTPIFYEGARDQHSVLQQLMEGKQKASVCFIRQRDFGVKNLKLKGGAIEDFQFLKGMAIEKIYRTQSKATQRALFEVGRNTAELAFDRFTEANLTELMTTFDFLIGILGECLNINAFDQPGVELGKKIAIENLQKSSGV